MQGVSVDSPLSLSARRAWIEMAWGRRGTGAGCVALRKESVDRNTTCRICRQHVIGSLSARRAWIEIEEDGILSTGAPVALRKESVDRNKMQPYIVPICMWSLSARRAWIEIEWAKAIFRDLGSLSARRAWIEMICRCRYAGQI